MRTGVAVEKLASQGSAEIGSLQDALQTICRARLDIFYPQIWPGFLGLRVFQQHSQYGVTGADALIVG
jgi:hypothetical protein